MSVAAGGATEQDEDLDEFLPELEELLLEPMPELPLWDRVFAFITGFGYRDNVLHSTVRSQGSGFWLAGGEFFLMRNPGTGTNFHFLVAAENLHFFEDSALPDERILTVVTQVSRDLTTEWSAGLGFQGFYNEQVMDVATEHLDLGTIDLKGGGVTATPFVRRNWAGGVYAEAGFAASRNVFRAPLDDYWEFGPKLSVGVGASPRQLTLSYEWLTRDYDDRRAVDREGNAMPDTDLAFHLHRAEASLQQRWGEEGRWRSRTRIGLHINEDQETGFYDYTRFRIAQQLSLRAGAWLIDGQVSYSRHEFDVQTASPDSEEARRRNSVSYDIGVQRPLTERLSFTVDYEREQVRGDIRLGDYTVNTVWSGLRLEL